MPYLPEYPVNESKTASIAASSTETITFAVPDDRFWRLKEITLTPGANTTIDDVRVDGRSVGITSSPIDFETEFGDLPLIKNDVVVEVTNAAASAEDTTIDVKGLEAL